MGIKTFHKPQKVSGLDIAFGANAIELMPPMAEIPDEFKGQHNSFVKWQQKWFFDGLKKKEILQIKPKTDINVSKALAHLEAIQSSFEPQHEHKQAGVAYLASLWFESI